MLKVPKCRRKPYFFRGYLKNWKRGKEKNNIPLFSFPRIIFSPLDRTTKFNKMTTQEAKKISMVDLLSNLGFNPAYGRNNDSELWYCSPLHNEKTPSFKITIDKNTWYDFGSGNGGSIIDFVIAFKRFDVRSCFQYLESLELISKEIDFKLLPSSKPIQVVELRSIKALNNPALCQYLKSRKIDLAIAARFIKEVYYRRGNTNYFSVGMKNDSNGYEVRSSIFKGCILSKDITSMTEGFNSISIFEGFTDFLSLLTFKSIKALKSDVIILHSNALANRAIDLIKTSKYEKIFCFLDNDQSGKQALYKFQNTFSEKVKDMRYLYPTYKDINEMLMNRK